MQAVLAIDTATDACSVALDHGGRIHFQHHVEARAHNRLLLPMIEAVLAEASLKPADLDAVVFGRGPGSFTGLRIAAAVTQALAWAEDLPVLGISSLEVLAAVALAAKPDATGVVTLIDARMEEWYWNVFEVTDAGLAAQGDDALGKASVIRERVTSYWQDRPGKWLWVGPEDHQELLPPAAAGVVIDTLPDLIPDARVLLQLALPRLRAGAGRPAAEAVPTYLRDASRWRRLDDAPLPSSAS